MSIKSWTALQYLKQVVLVEDGKIKRGIPPHPPRTIYRRAGVVCEFGDKLALAKHASFELWDTETEKNHRSFHHRMILAPHDICQFGPNLLICSSGLELFFLMDIDGNVIWEWWGYENGLGGKNEYYFRPDWVTNQTTSDLCEVAPEEAAHFNHIWLTGKKRFITSALRKKKIVEITVGEQGYKIVADIEEKGCHSPIYHGDTLIYGTEAGIKVGDKKVLNQYEWVKYIRPFENGFAFTHERGVVITDAAWQTKEEISLPAPYGFAFLERVK